MGYSSTLATVVLGTAALTAGAQQPAPQPATSTPPGSSMQYDSAFTNYLPMQEVKMAPTLDDWRMANDTVGLIGGHAGVLKAGQPAAEAAPKPGAPAGHGGMHMKKNTDPAGVQPAASPIAPVVPAGPAASVTPAKTSPHQGH